jgi:hypothetical protein
MSPTRFEPAFNAKAKAIANSRFSGQGSSHYIVYKTTQPATGWFNE